MLLSFSRHYDVPSLHVLERMTFLNHVVTVPRVCFPFVHDAVVVDYLFSDSGVLWNAFLHRGVNVFRGPSLYLRLTRRSALMAAGAQSSGELFQLQHVVDAKCSVSSDLVHVAFWVVRHQFSEK